MATVHPIDERTEATMYATALRESTPDPRQALSSALAQADAFMEQLVEGGRYRTSVTPAEQESDRLLLALALLRARRNGFEDGVAISGWWQASRTADKVTPLRTKGGVRAR